MPTVTVVDAGAVAPRRNPDTGLIVRRTLGPATGLDVLEQAVLECPAGRSRPIAVGEAEETLFVLGGAGDIHLRDGSHPLQAEEGVYLPPGTTFSLESTGADPLRLIAVRVPDPSPGPPSPPRVRRLADQPAEPATAGRELWILADPTGGLRSATHFVGAIPAGRAPDHFHAYDELIYVLDGRGLLHGGGGPQEVGPGSCIQIPAGAVHCLQNTGEAPLRLVATLRPAGSPAAAFYPDGTPVQVGPATPGG